MATSAVISTGAADPLRRQRLPPQLAYGERGVPGRTAAITGGPNEASIFDLELLAIKQAGPVSGQPVETKAKSRKD